MKKTKIVLGLLMLVTTTAIAQQVKTDYQKDVNFGAYKTFSWIKEPKTANPLMGQRIFDAKTKEAIWRGTSSKTLSSKPEKNAASLNKAIAKMFDNFPPETNTHQSGSKQD